MAFLRSLFTGAREDKFYYEPSPRFWHQAAPVGEKLFMWGGRTQNWSFETRSRLASVVEAYDPYLELWEQHPTSGTLPVGLYHGACASLLDSLYSYGGRDIIYRGGLYHLDATSMNWSEVEVRNPSEGPMKKVGSRMVSYQGNKLLLAGGYGIPTTDPQPGATFHRNMYSNGSGWTNEVHLFHLPEGVWTSPATTGTKPPPCRNFSLTSIDPKRAVFFGGRQEHDRVNDVYILDLEVMHWTKVDKTGGGPWPVERSAHAACCINYGQEHPQVLVTGGLDKNDKMLGDAWLLDVDSATWKRLALPADFPPRGGHTTTAFSLAPGLTEVTMFGGYNKWHSTVASDDQLPKIAETTVFQLESIETPSSSGTPSTREWVLVGVARIGQLGSAERLRGKIKMQNRKFETIRLAQGAMSLPTPQIEMEQLNQKLAEEVQEYKSALAHSQQMQQSLTLALAEKELQLSSRPAKMIEFQTALDRERGQRKEGEKQLKTNQKELHEMKLKVEELQEEKEKLEVQLQSSQDSIKEVQEQLTPPEKMDQAIQTHREPSYLQILAQTLEKEREFQATLKQRESQLDWERKQRETVEQQHKVNERELNEMRLQINELQEREKLHVAGQSQSSQTCTTGEPLTTKETQEQLSQPEKKDHFFQRCAEPPFLQTSKALHLRGVHVVGETTFTVSRHATTLNWEEYGFAIHIPEGVLPPDVEQCHIHIKATIRGQFQLSDDHELVSAVFWIWCRHKLSKPAMMEIEHCAAITTGKQCSALTFVRTHCSQEELPYSFVPITKGVFSPGSSYGSILVSQFSGFAISHRKRRQRMKHEHPPSTSGKRITTSPVYNVTALETEANQAVEEEFVHYCAQLYCAKKGMNAWLLYFVLMRDLKVEMQAVMAYFSGKATPEIESIKLTLEADKITLDIPLEGIDIPEGWKVTPCYCPTITKEDTIRFTSGSAMPAVCELLAEWKDETKRPHRLTHKTTIVGACAPRNHFLLIVDPTGPDMAQDSMPNVKSPQQSSAGCPKPELKALVLIPVNAWYKLGLQLDINCTELDHIRDNYYKDSETCKIEMFKLWLRKNPSSSYEQLVNALDTIGEKAEVDNLCKKYGIPLPGSC